ncbi:MAG: hypothetical protein AB7S75_18005 [Desulfococcaceae bacterium]
MSSQMKSFCAVCVGVWNAAGSPYIVTDNVTVNAGVTLRGETGVCGK